MTYYKNAEGGEPGSYFSAPHSELDPHLFSGMRLRTNVRDFIIRSLMDELREMGLRGMDAWLHLWIIGSSVSYQWQTKGDMDVTFSATMPEFIAENPDWAGLTTEQVSTEVKRHIREHLAPRTAHHNFNGQSYEVTYFWNPEVADGRDIASLHPYAAYDVLNNSWTIEPEHLPQDPGKTYSREWYQAATRDTETVSRISVRYNALQRQLKAVQPGSAAWHTAGSQLHLAVSQAHAQFEDLHTARAAAFSGQGHGYHDWGNFRWQEAKRSGVVDTLTDIINTGNAAKDAEEQATYGQTIQDANEALFRATMVHQNRRGFN